MRIGAWHVHTRKHFFLAFAPLNRDKIKPLAEKFKLYNRPINVYRSHRSSDKHRRICSALMRNEWANGTFSDRAIVAFIILYSMRHSCFTEFVGVRYSRLVCRMQSMRYAEWRCWQRWRVLRSPQHVSSDEIKPTCRKNSFSVSQLML